jgi:hypothetical protein
MITPHNYYNQLEGFYKVGKVFGIGNSTPESITDFDFGPAEYKHKGIFIDAIDGSSEVELKFYDPNSPGGITDTWFKITIQATPTNFVSCIIPVKVAKIRITNPLAGAGSMYPIQVGLLN